MSEIRKNVILVLLLFLNPLGQLLTDMYLPAFPAIQNSFNTSTYVVQLSLSIYLFFYGISQFVFGVSSDFLGRKKPLLVGLLFCFVGLLISILAPNYNLFLIGRVFQGIGVGIGAIIVPIAVDLFSGKKLFYCCNYLNFIYSFSLIIAPYIGGYIVTYFTWRQIFIVLLLYLFLLAFAITIILPETNNNKYKISYIKLWENVRRLFCNKSFILLIFLMGCSWGIFISLAVLGPFLFQKVLGYSSYEYGSIMLLVSGGYLSANIINRILLKYYTPLAIIFIGITIGMLIPALFLLVTLAGYKSGFLIMVFSFLAIFPSGFLFANCWAFALSLFPDIAGLASGFLLSFLSIFWSLLAVLIGWCPTLQITLAVAYFVLFLVCTVLFILLIPSLKTDTCSVDNA